MGKVCEIGPSDGLDATPVHPYTRALLAAIPGDSGGSANRGDKKN